MRADTQVEKMQRILILGAGGNAGDILDTIQAINTTLPKWLPMGFLDDRREVGFQHMGLSVLGALKEASGIRDCKIVSSIWNERISSALETLIESLGVSRERFATLCHPTASISTRATLGCDVLVHQGASIAAGVVIHDHVSIGPGCIVGHDTVIEKYSCLAAGAIISGGVEIATGCYVGSGSTVRQNLSVGRGALVGMGAVVVRNVDAGDRVVGNPARPMVRDL